MKLNREQEELLALIRKIWEGNPSLRFSQLLGKCMETVSTRDIYFISDDQWIYALEHTYGGMRETLNRERDRD